MMMSIGILDNTGLKAGMRGSQEAVMRSQDNAGSDGTALLSSLPDSRPPSPVLTKHAYQQKAGVVKIAYFQKGFFLSSFLILCKLIAILELRNSVYYR
jgi:hypothetical protein